ncbi:hypothetical protein DTO027I6_10039 [Penicillium roqueforti]|nr:hypothetical protein CBS147337_10306 [Penicillium roqueforti]KAI3184053.1 hypothetical protein DTO027I6_10039 [Penicillium roqueforti]
MGMIIAVAVSPWLATVPPAHAITFGLPLFTYRSGLAAAPEQAFKLCQGVLPGSSGFANTTTWWSALEEPMVNVAVVPGTAPEYTLETDDRSGW